MATLPCVLPPQPDLDKRQKMTGWIYKKEHCVNALSQVVKDYLV